VSPKRIIIVIAAAALLAAGSASADSYGGVSYATQQNVKQLVYAEFGHNWKAEAMIRCIRRESGFNARAFAPRDSHGGSAGLTQINGVHGPGGYMTAAFKERMFNPVENLKQAHRLMNSSGLGPWRGC
jgi:hypothetical protein